MFIVTGATSGIGYATTAVLMKRGESVIAVGRNFSVLETLQTNFPAQVQLINADLSLSEGIDAVTSAASTGDTLKGIVHAAGSPIHLADYQSLLAGDLVEDVKVHVAAPIALNNLLSKQLAGGRIVFLDSYSATTLRVGWAGYSIIKAAAQMAARSAVEEIDESDVIRVFPGAVRTPLVESLLNAKSASPAVAAFKALDAEGKIADAKDIGEFIADILTRASTQELGAREYWDFNEPADRIF